MLFTGFLPSFNGFPVFYHLVGPGFTEICEVLRGCNGFYRVLLGLMEYGWVSNTIYWVFPGFYRGLLGFTGFYQVLPGFTGFYWVLPGFTGFYWVLPGFTRFYRVLLGFTGFYRVWQGLSQYERVSLGVPGCPVALLFPGHDDGSADGRWCRQRRCPCGRGPRGGSFDPSGRACVRAPAGQPSRLHNEPSLAPSFSESADRSAGLIFSSFVLFLSLCWFWFVFFFHRFGLFFCSSSGSIAKGLSTWWQEKETKKKEKKKTKKNSELSRWDSKNGSN